MTKVSGVLWTAWGIWLLSTLMIIRAIVWAARVGIAKCDSATDCLRCYLPWACLASALVL
jgi:hypothetical protein